MTNLHNTVELCKFICIEGYGEYPRQIAFDERVNGGKGNLAPIQLSQQTPHQAHKRTRLVSPAEKGDDERGDEGEAKEED